MKLSEHPQGPAIIAALAANGHPDAGETPIVPDRFAPHGTAYFGDDRVFMNPAAVEIESVYICPTGMTLPPVVVGPVAAPRRGEAFLERLEAHERDAVGAAR
jgi:hypothetical protein